MIIASGSFVDKHKQAHIKKRYALTRFQKENPFLRDHYVFKTKIEKSESKVIYEFTCSCDANLTYIGMSTRHLSTRAKEHLDFNSQVSSAIKNHIMCCNVCSSVKLNLNSFKIIKKCKSEFHTKIHEALFIKKRNPGLNRQLYANGSSFLLNVF